MAKLLSVLAVIVGAALVIAALRSAYVELTAVPSLTASHTSVPR